MNDPGIQPGIPPDPRRSGGTPLGSMYAAEGISVRREEENPLGVLIPTKNPKSLVAYYCGVFALIPCLGLVLGPIALIYGVLAVKFAKANPQAKGMVHAIVGVVLGALTTLANSLAVAGVLVGLMAAVTKR